MKIACRKLNLSEEQLKKYLYNLRINKKLSINQMMEETGLSYSSIRSLISECKIPQVKSEFTQVYRNGNKQFYELYGFKTKEEFRNYLVELYYINNLSQPKIASNLGCLVGQVSKQFRDLDIPKFEF